MDDIPPTACTQCSQILANNSLNVAHAQRTCAVFHIPFEARASLRADAADSELGVAGGSSPLRHAVRSTKTSYSDTDILYLS